MEIIEGQRRSKTKRWELVRILEKNTAVDLAAMQTQSAILAEELKEDEENTDAPSESATDSEATGDAATAEESTDGDQESK